MREVQGKIGLYVQSSYVYPIEINRSKLSKMKSCQPLLPNNTNIFHTDF